MVITFFGSKSNLSSLIKPHQIILVEDDEIISDSVKCAEVLNNFFIDAAIYLDIARKRHTESVTGITDPVEQAIEKYKCHPSIIKIQALYRLYTGIIQALYRLYTGIIQALYRLYTGFIQATFNFCPISIPDMQKEICNLHSSKAY